MMKMIEPGCELMLKAIKRYLYMLTETCRPLETDVALALAQIEVAAFSSMKLMK